MGANGRWDSVREFDENELESLPELVAGSYLVPVDPMEGLGCDSCE